jgi:orotidine-5'-phosphate decarboxylase
VGATFPDDLRALRSKHPDVHFLIPGVGAQGGDAAETAKAGATALGRGFVINSARGIIYASKSNDIEDIQMASLAAAQKLRDEINDALNSSSITQTSVTID